MSVVLNAKISNTLAKNVTDGDRLGVAKKLKLLVKLITQLKSDSFHLKINDLIR